MFFIGYGGTLIQETRAKYLAAAKEAVFVSRKEVLPEDNCLGICCPNMFLANVEFLGQTEREMNICIPR